MAKLSAAAIRKQFPENGKLAGIADDVQKYAAISSVANQEGGRILIGALIEDVITGVESAAYGYSTKTHAELMAVCAGLKANLDLMRILVRSHRNKDDARAALAEALKEEGAQAG